MAQKKKGSRKGAKAFAWDPWVNALALAAWSALLLWGFEKEALGHAANTDGGLLFARSITTLGYIFAVLALWASGKWKALPPLAALLSGLVPLLMFEGARASAGEIFTLDAMPWYIGSNIAFAAVILLDASQASKAVPAQSEGRPAALAWAYGLLAALALGALLIFIRNWALASLKVPAEKNSLGLFFNPRAGGGATDISARPFSEYYRLLAPLQYLGMLAGALFLYMRVKKLEERWIWMALLALAVLGKLSIAFVSDHGLGILGVKVASINTNYYNLTDLIRQKGLWGYLSGYNELQAGQGAHGDTHPFGPVVFYWVLTLFLGKSPALIAFVMAVLAGLSAPLIYRIASGYYRSQHAGLAAALIFLSSPMSLILSSAGIDSIVLLWMALAFWALQRGHEEPHWKWGLIAGAFFFLGSLFSFGLAISMMFAGLWTVQVRLKDSRGLKEAAFSTLLLWGPLLLVALLGHGLLYAGLAGKFSYVQSMNTAQFIHRSMNQYRTYEMWSWANAVLFAGYAGAATMAIWLLRQASALWRSDSRDGFLLLSLPFALTLVFACMGRAEVQREFLFGVLFLALPAAPYFLEAGKGGKGQLALRPWLLFAMVSLNVLSATVLEMTVLDFW